MKGLEAAKVELHIRIVNTPPQPGGYHNTQSQANSSQSSSDTAESRIVGTSLLRKGSDKTNRKHGMFRSQQTQQLTDSFDGQA
jgi:hypothetical protein